MFLLADLVMPFTCEEVRAVDYMIEYYNLSKETFVFSEENDDLFRRLFQGSSASTSTPAKYSYSQLDLGSLIMTLMKKNVFFVSSIDKARGQLSAFSDTPAEYFHTNIRGHKCVDTAGCTHTDTLAADAIYIKTLDWYVSYKFLRLLSD